MASSTSLEQGRSPFDNVFQILPHGHDKALKQAFYNTGATLFAVVVCIAAVAVYYILEVFLRPLLWAILCGTFLYPFKNKLTGVVQGWLKRLRVSGFPLVFGGVLLPFEVADYASEVVGNAIFNQLRAILIFCCCLTLTYFFYYVGPLQYLLLTIVPNLFYFVYEALGYFRAIWVWTLVIAYVLVVIFYWNPQSIHILRLLSVPVWVAFLFHLATITGPFRIPIFLLVSLTFVFGFVAEVKEAANSYTEPQTSSSTGADVPMSPTQYVTAAAWRVWSNVNHSRVSDVSTEEVVETDDSPQGPGHCIPPSSSDDSIEVIKAGDAVTPEEEITAAGVTDVGSKEAASGSTQRPPLIEETPRITRIDSLENSDVGLECDPRTLSDQCFIWLLWAAALVMIWRHFIVIMPLMPLFLAILIVKKLADKFGSRQWVKNKYFFLKEKIGNDPRAEVLAPKSIRGIGRMLLRGDRKVVRGMEKSMDKVVSILLILLLFIGLFLFSFFMAIQVQRESMHLVTLSGNVFNNSVHPELKQWLPNGEEMQKTVDAMVGNAHHYGRRWITTKLHSMFSGDVDSKDVIEKEVLELWDKIYEVWFTRRSALKGEGDGDVDVDVEQDGEGYEVTARRNNSMAIFDWNNLWNAMKTSDFSFNILSIINENIDLVMSISESVWILVKSNVSLATHVLTAVLSALLGGGTAILNFVLSMVVFLTTLFYLLSFSGSQYKPMEWIQGIAPAQGAGGGKFGKAVEEAIASVFMASLKMAAFYGGYTWLTHTVFGINIVFIPSALAMMFAAIPFVGTYWAALPAVLELWLVNGQTVLAVVMLLCHLVPTYVVDTAIYSEIKGGHPYPTGLAIAGGIYWLGLEGAIIGPILLCSLLVAVNVYSTMMKPETIQPAARGSKSQSNARRVQFRTLGRYVLLELV